MGKDGKPRGKMSSYAFFVQTCREEHKKKHPGEQVVFAEFSKKCSEKWKAMSAKEKQRFEEMAEKDKGRFEKEMASFEKSGGGGGGKGAKGGKGKRKKDPNAPKRALSAFFCFCNDERPKVKAAHPGYSVGDIAKELGRRWESCPNKSKYEAMANKDKERYEREMAAYKGGGGGSKKPAAKAPAKAAARDDDDDDDEDDDEDEEEDDESD